MKKYTLYILLLAVYNTNAQDTLRHFDPQSQVPTAAQYTGTQSGYYTGHNSLFDEEWGEKYYINGANQVTGVIAYHTGSNGTYTKNCEYKVYSVGSNGLPVNELGKEAVAGSSIDISGAASFTAFSSAVNVSDSFIITFNVDDYAHHSPGTKRIALMHSPDGSRDNSDTTVYGRTVIRWHGHTPTWKDFYKENINTKLKAHFAIFPVLAMKNVSVNDFASSGSIQMHAAYPNPATNMINLNIKGIIQSDISCIIMDTRGVVVKRWNEKLNTSEQTISADIAALPSGQYIFIVGDGSGQLAQTFVKQ